MENSVSNDQMSRLSEFIASSMGLDFPPARWTDLQRGIVTAAREFNFADLPQFIDWLLSTPLSRHQLEMLAGNLTVGETYFFRENKSFEILAAQILPALIRARQGNERRLRIWSAACCTGEEPYSIAILLKRTIPDIQNWNISLLATDINPRFLQKAAAGIFGKWSFRDAPPWLEQYFRKTPEGRFEILPEIKKMVHFAQLNLAQDVYPSLTNDTNAMDVIFCRNVLMYFTPPQSKRVIQSLYRAQLEGGWLIVSSTEIPHISAISYHSIVFAGMTLFQKDSTRPHGRKIAPQTPANHFPQSNQQAVDSWIAAHPPTPLQPALATELAAPPKESTTPTAAQLYDQGKYAEATQSLQASLLTHPGDPHALGLLARSLANQGRLAEALACCDEWIRLDKLSPAGHYLRAVIVQERGGDDAVASLRRALYLDPKFVLAHFAMANIARINGNVREAAKHLENTLELLRSYPQDQVLPESDGITAGRFAEIVHSVMNVEAAV